VIIFMEGEVPVTDPLPTPLPVQSEEPVTAVLLRSLDTAARSDATLPRRLSGGIRDNRKEKR
jgi:hypothetical protein